MTTKLGNKCQPTWTVPLWALSNIQHLEAIDFSTSSQFMGFLKPFLHFWSCLPSMILSFNNTLATSLNSFAALFFLSHGLGKSSNLGWIQLLFSLPAPKTAKHSWRKYLMGQTVPDRLLPTNSWPLALRGTSTNLSLDNLLVLSSLWLEKLKSSAAVDFLFSFAGK